MKTMKNLILMLFLFATTAQSFAQYGSVIDEEAMYEVAVDEEFAVWCRNSLGKLDRSRAKASREVFKGNYSAAMTILLNGLAEASTRSFGSINPATQNLMRHAHNVGTAMVRNVGQDVRGLKTSIVATEAFYDLIKRTAYNVDFRYYRSSCGYCRNRNTMEFESEILDMVYNMLAIVNDNLTITRAHSVYPVGPTSAYLTASEVVASAGYKELKELLYANSYACEILDLKDLSQELRAFNRTAHPEIAKKEMFYDSFREMSRLSRMLSSGYSCYRR